MAASRQIEQTLSNGSVLVVEVTDGFLSWGVWCSEGKCSGGQHVLSLDEAVRMATRRK